MPTTGDRLCFAVVSPPCQQWWSNDERRMTEVVSMLLDDSDPAGRHVLTGFPSIWVEQQAVTDVESGGQWGQTMRQEGKLVPGHVVSSAPCIYSRSKNLPWH